MAVSEGGFLQGSWYNLPFNALYFFEEIRKCRRGWRPDYSHPELPPTPLRNKKYTLLLGWGGSLDYKSWSMAGKSVLSLVTLWCSIRLKWTWELFSSQPLNLFMPQTLNFLMLNRRVATTALYCLLFCFFLSFLLQWICLRWTVLGNSAVTWDKFQDHRGLAWLPGSQLSFWCSFWRGMFLLRC